MSRPAIPCEVCGHDLAQDVGRGWVRWWADLGGPRPTRLARFEVVCVGRCEETREREGEAQFPDLVGLDGHLDWFTGAWAMLQLCRLLREHDWDRKALERAAEFFEAAAQLPTGAGPPCLG